jgi:Zn-finger nucleic acid-binding protein
MKCPMCNADLLMTTREMVEMDYCQQCRGIWLERGKLDKIVERSMQYNSDREYQEEHGQKKRRSWRDILDFD